VAALLIVNTHYCDVCLVRTCMSQEEDFPGAIQLCLECQKAASTYKHYHCIRSFEVLYVFT